ncbi:hypothetical protein [Brachybacterium sp.]|uniref:variant leucine-rich repeat-containing protein n=1 Tax=Brachybacterium sp. TaxID=1891286 RepID=UPI002ED45496
MAEPRSAAEEAGDPSTSPERLLELTEKHPQLQKLIVLNPSCPEVARQWILATNPWAKQAYEKSLAPATDPEPGAGAEEDEEDRDAVSVWGDLGTPSASSGSDAAPASSVRIARNAGVVPLGPAASSTAATPQPAPTAPTAFPAPAAPPAPRAPESTPAPAASSAAPAAPGPRGASPAPGGPAVAPAPAPGFAGSTTETDDDGSRTRVRALWACGGCLVLALLLVIVAALAGRAWLGGDEEQYQRDSSTTSAQEAPTEEPSEEATEETPSQDPVSPAPDDAQEMTALSSPTGNITCLLEEDSVACSVVDRDFSEAGLEDCSDGPFSIMVAEGEATADCGSSYLSDSAETLEYDQSATYGDMACTSRFDGMTCWNTMTGKGFMVNRATYETL